MLHIVGTGLCRLDMVELHGLGLGVLHTGGFKGRVYEDELRLRNFQTTRQKFEWIEVGREAGRVVKV